MEPSIDQFVNGVAENAPLPANYRRLRSGVVVDFEAVSPFALSEIQRQMAKAAPTPPKVYIEDKGREEENENDPAYQRALALHQSLLVERLYDLALATSVTVVEIPAGMAQVDDTAWADDLTLLGIEIAEKGGVRRAHWLKHVAAKHPDDLRTLMRATLDTMGTSEEEVAEALETFQGVAQRGIPDAVNSP